MVKGLIQSMRRAASAQKPSGSRSERSYISLYLASSMNARPFSTARAANSRVRRIAKLGSAIIAPPTTSMIPASPICDINSTGAGRRELHVLSGAFDPQLVDRPGEPPGILFGSFANLSFSLYVAPAEPDTLAPPVTLTAERQPAEWTWPELKDPQYARTDAAPYERRFTLDFAAGDALVAPGIGSAQGAVFIFSDLLSDHVVFVGVSSFQGSGLGNLLDNFNGSVFYLNQARRVNWGVGAFRQRGLFYEGDLSTLFEETSHGVFTQVRYPLTRFKRLEGEYRLERSDRFDLFSPGVAEPRREAWLASNYLSYVKDNTLWIATGPIDGERFNATGGLIASGPTDLVGRPLPVPFVSTFTTADGDPPVIVSAFPSNNAAQIDIFSVPRLAFSEPVSPTNFTFTLTGPGGAVAGNSNRMGTRPCWPGATVSRLFPPAVTMPEGSNDQWQSHVTVCRELLITMSCFSIVSPGKKLWSLLVKRAGPPPM